MPHSHWYRTGYLENEELARLKAPREGREKFKDADFTVNDHEPHVVISWDKKHADSASGEVGDQGYVHVALEVSPEWLREQVRRLDIQEAAAKAGEGVFGTEPNVTLGAGPLTWQDLNVLAKTARQARDDAFGKPE